MRYDAGKIAQGYVTAMLWSSTDDNDTPLDANYDSDDLAPCAMAEVNRVCNRFAELIDNLDLCGRRGETVESLLGHDLWLTSRSHGAGFWDGDWDVDGPTLETLCYRAHGGAIERLQGCGESPYVGDDNLIYLT